MAVQLFVTIIRNMGRAGSLVMRGKLENWLLLLRHEVSASCYELCGGTFVCLVLCARQKDRASKRIGATPCLCLLSLERIFKLAYFNLLS